MFAKNEHIRSKPTLIRSVRSKTRDGLKPPETI